MTDVHDPGPPVAVVDVADPATRDALAKARVGALLNGVEMAAIFGVTPKHFSRLKRTGKFNQFMVLPAIGGRCYSGVLVSRYLDGEPLYSSRVQRKGGVS